MADPRQETGSMNQFDYDQAEMGWKVAMALWLENRDSAPRIAGWSAARERGEGEGP